MSKPRLLDLFCGAGGASDGLARAGFEAILHFAAFIEAGESMREPGRFFRNNVTGSLNLIDAAVAHGVGRFPLAVAGLP